MTDKPTIAQVAVLAEAMVNDLELPNAFVIEQAELYLLRLWVRGWRLVNVDEDGGDE